MFYALDLVILCPQPVAHERPGLLPNVTDASDAVVVVLVDRSIQDGSPSFTGQNTFAESHPSAVTVSAMSQV